MSQGTDRDMLPEYDFSSAVRAGYAERFGAKKDEVRRTAAAMDALCRLTTVKYSMRFRVLRAIPRIPR